jgi:DNA-binding XRE family transcriptional regulator
VVCFLDAVRRFGFIADVSLMPGGRPSKYDPAFCEQVIACLAKGHSVTAFAGEIGVSRATIFNWANENPEFLDALKTGQALATKFWEQILVDVAKEAKGNATAAIFGLKNRASEDWSDKVVNEHTGKDGAPIAITSDTEAARRIAFVLEAAARKTEG